jgi:hypothetical protein
MWKMLQDRSEIKIPVQFYHTKRVKKHIIFLNVN